MKVVCSRGRGIFEHGKQGSIRAFKFLPDLPPSLRANAADGSLFDAASSAIEDVFIRMVAKWLAGVRKQKLRLLATSSTNTRRKANSREIARAGLGRLGP